MSFEWSQDELLEAEWSFYTHFLGLSFDITPNKISEQSARVGGQF